MHQIHPIAEFREFQYEARSFGKFNTTEHQERAGRKQHTVDGAESPPYFQHGRGEYFSGNGLNIERIYGNSCTNEHRNNSDNKTFGTVPGQMDMYIRMYDELKRSEGDNPTIGIVLCSDTDEDIAKYSILHGNEQLFASKYKLYLPTEEELRAEIENQKTMFYLQQQENDE